MTPAPVGPKPKALVETMEAAMGRVTELLVRSGYIAGLLAFAYIALNAHTPAGLVIGAVVLLALIPFVAKRLADHSRS